MKIRKLESTNAFLALDLEGAPAAGFVRCAPKILQGGAKDFARSRTYTYASFEEQRGGLSGGISAPPEEADAAIAAFVAELEAEAGAGTLTIEPAKGVSAEAIAGLSGAGASTHEASTQLAAGIVAAAEAASGPLDGRTVVLEGFDANGPALASTLTNAGARLVAVATTKGTALNSNGFVASDLEAAWTSDGADLPAALSDGEAAPASVALRTECDVLFAGSKAGAISHVNAPDVQTGTLVPSGLLPFTARAMAMLQRADTVVVPDFLSLAGPIIGTPDIADQIRAAVTEASSHDEGLVLGACVRAEAFLASWQETLPFGRPMAP